MCTARELSHDCHTIEFLLNSIFPKIIIKNEVVILASNGSIEYRYTRTNHGNTLEFRPVSLEEPDDRFKLHFEKNPIPLFMINNPNYEILCKFFDFSELENQ